MNNSCHRCDQDFPIEDGGDYRSICPACGGCACWCGEDRECFTCDEVGRDRKGERMTKQEERIERAITALFDHASGCSDKGILSKARQEWTKGRVETEIQVNGELWAGNPNADPVDHGDIDYGEGGEGPCPVDPEYQRGLVDALMAVDRVLANYLNNANIMPMEYQKLRRVRDDICRLPQWMEAGVEPPAIPGDMRRDPRRK